MKDLGRFFGDEWRTRCLRRAHRLFANSDIDPEDACQEAMTGLLEAFQRVPAESLTDAYVWTAYKNELVSVMQRAFGKDRPPEWISRLGEPWITIYRYFCYQRIPPAVIQDLLGLAAQVVDDAIARLRTPRPGQKGCPSAPARVSVEGHSVGDEEHEEVGIALVGPAVGEPLESVEEAEWVVLLGVILGVAEEGNPRPGIENYVERLPEPTAAKWRLVAGALELDDEDRLLLRLRFAEGLSEPEVGVAVGMEKHTARRRLKQVCERIRGTLTAHGIELSDLA